MIFTPVTPKEVYEKLPVLGEYINKRGLSDIDFNIGNYIGYIVVSHLPYEMRDYLIVIDEKNDAVVLCYCFDMRLLTRVLNLMQMLDTRDVNMRVFKAVDLYDFRIGNIYDLNLATNPSPRIVVHVEGGEWV